MEISAKKIESKNPTELEFSEYLILIGGIMIWTGIALNQS